MKNGLTIPAALGAALILAGCGGNDGPTSSSPTSSNPATLAITTTSLSNAQQAVAYSATLVATGGDGSYAWSVTVGSLPTELSLNTSTGVISGTPTVAETQNFTVQVASGDGQTAAGQLSITVPLVYQSVSAGFFYSCGVKEAGGAYCWGNNTNGQLGDGTFTARNVSAAVSGGLTFQSLSAGQTFSCGVTTAGDAYCWGNALTVSTVPVAVPGGLTFQSVSPGVGFSCGVTTAGDAYCWGENTNGELGDGTTTAASNVPVAVSGGLTFQSVSAGFGFSCGVTTAGDAYCWGSNAAGEGGNGTNTKSNVPVAVSGGLTFQSVSTGSDHSCGVTTAGAAYCWGFNGSGLLGDGTTTAASNVPVAVLGGLTFQSVTAGGTHSCGVTTAGVPYCWGGNTNGELGDGTNTNSNVPVGVTGGLTYQSVIAGDHHSCGLTTAGAAYCWGLNVFGSLGDGTNTDSNVPVVVR